jgi:tetratricopeptide (TPR) repeat protein
MGLRLVFACCLAAALVPPSITSAGISRPSLQAHGRPADDGELRQRVVLMGARLKDENSVFISRDLMGELEVLRAYVGTRSELLSERRDILSMMGLVALRSAVLAFQQGIEPLAELMALGEADDRPLGLRISDHHTYAELLAGYASMPGNESSHARAAEHYGKAALLADDEDSGVTDGEIAAIRQKQAYELHEAKRYGDALAINRDVLSRFEKLNGHGDANLVWVLTDLARNLHALGRKDEVEPYLIRAQTIAEAADDLRTVQDILFQRAMLAYQMGQIQKAYSVLRDRIDRLREAADTEYLAKAKEDYEILLGGRTAATTR